MRRIVFFTVASLLVVSCAREHQLTPEQLAAERDAVKAAFARWLEAYTAEDMAGITSLMTSSGDLLVLGTDSAEVMRSTADVEAQMTADWTLLDSTKIGEVRNEHIVVSNGGDLAAAVFEVPVDAVAGGQPMHALWRIALAYRKEAGEWRIVHAVPGVATSGQSSAELVAKMQEQTKGK